MRKFGAPFEATGEPLKWEDVKKMSYTTVIQEALRYSSIVFFFQRRVKQEFKLDGYDIPKGWDLIVDTHDLQQHDPQNYLDPQTFDPTRFDKRPKPYTFMPFAVGPRMCLGKDMAMLQMCIFLHHVVLKCKWTVTDKKNSREYRGGPHFKNGVPFRVDAINYT